MDTNTKINAAIDIALIGLIIYVAILGIKVALNNNKQKQKQK